MLKMYLKQPNPLKDEPLPVRKADQKAPAKTPRYRYIPLIADWQQTGRHLTGTIKVTEELAALFQPGNEIKILTFPDRPKAAVPKVPSKKPTP